MSARDRQPLLPDEAWPQRISRILAWIAGAAVLIGCSLSITIDVLARYFLNRGLVESFEISGYALAACVGLGMAFSVTTRAHIRVDFLVGKLPHRLRIVFDLGAAIALAVVLSALAWFAWKTLAQSWSMNAKSISRMQVPMAIPQGIWVAGLVWCAAMAVLLPAQALLRLLRGDRAGADALIASPNLEDEITLAGVEEREARG